MLLRQYFYDRFHQETVESGVVQQLPPVFHRRTENAGYARTRGTVQEALQAARLKNDIPGRQESRRIGTPFCLSRMAETKKFNYGGQAVIEGVMIRGRKAVVTAVRRPGGDITVDSRPIPTISSGRLRRIPLTRGVVVLIEAMVLGIKSLLYSANIAMEEEEEEIPTKAIWGMLAAAAVLVIILFFITPLFLTRLVDDFIPNSLVFHIIEGVVRLAIFIAYLKIMSMLSDIKRVFAYHGAEHKTVNAHEAGVPMEVESIKVHSKAHVRCGTSFLFLVLIIAIIVFAFIGRDILWLMIVSRVVLIPVIMALGYEVIYFGSKHTNNWFMKIVLAPGLFMQSLTTREPDDSQIEVAIAAMNKAVEIDQSDEAVQASSGPVSESGTTSS